jgi:hypothetical protein
VKRVVVRLREQLSDVYTVPTVSPDEDVVVRARTSHVEVWEHGVAWAPNQIPFLPVRDTGSAPPIWRPRDDTAGIAATNRARRTFAAHTLRRVPRGRRSS